MSCDNCDDEWIHMLKIYPFRVGNKETGYGTIGVIACPAHAKLVMERLREQTSTAEGETQEA